MVFTNIPWTQVVLAICTGIGTTIALITIFHKLATQALKDAVIELKLDLKEISHSVHDLNTKVGMQNGRIGKMEDWKVDHILQSSKMFDFITDQLNKK